MNEIEKKAQEIDCWADTKGHGAFILLRDGDKQLTIVNTSSNELADMLVGIMMKNKDVANTVRKAVLLHIARS